MKNLLREFGIAIGVTTFAANLPTIISNVDIVFQVTVAGIFIVTYAGSLLFLLRDAGFIQKGQYEIYKIW